MWEGGIMLLLSLRSNHLTLLLPVHECDESRFVLVLLLLKGSLEVLHLFEGFTYYPEFGWEGKRSVA